uniref:Glucan endo-1,3-beta-D-glucosidase n=1 Tax=Oryza barthii TaxID=65489 RepID=A0A0D3GT73_9ORYZ
MENVHAALAAASLGHIKVTTSISEATIGIHIPPSASEVVHERYVIPFLERTHAPLLANLYPYFIIYNNSGGMDISFALFTASERAAAGGGGHGGYTDQEDRIICSLYNSMGSTYCYRSARYVNYQS